jgi:hypothetical protein
MCEDIVDCACSNRPLGLVFVLQIQGSAAVSLTYSLNSTYDTCSVSVGAPPPRLVRVISLGPSLSSGMMSAIQVSGGIWLSGTPSYWCSTVLSAKSWKTTAFVKSDQRNIMAGIRTVISPQSQVKILEAPASIFHQEFFHRLHAKTLVRRTGVHSQLTHRCDRRSA